MTSLLLLPAYILLETLRAVLCYAALHSLVPVSSTLITFSAELLKLFFALFFLFRHLETQKQYDQHVTLSTFKSAILFASGDGNGVTGRGTGTATGTETQTRRAWWRSYLPFAIPAALYLTNNLLYLLGLQVAAPSLLHVAMLAKLPLTGLLHHLLVRRQENAYAWLSLAGICTGLLVFNAPADVLDWLSTMTNTAGTADSNPNVPVQVPGFSVATLLGPAIGLTIATFSACASIFTEVVLKKEVSFWVAQTWLYLYGAAFAGTIALFWDGRAPGTMVASSSSTPTSAISSSSSVSLSWVFLVYAAVIVATAATGLVVANILRKADNLVKIVGTSCCVVTIILAQVAIFPALRAGTVQPHVVLGVGVVAVATWTYNYYKGVGREQNIVVRDVEVKMVGYVDEEGKEEELGREVYKEEHPWRVQQTGLRESKSMTPSWKKILGASTLVSVLTVLTSLYTPSPVATTHPIAASPSTSLSAVHGQKDVARFFVPHNITPSTWGATENPSKCITDFINRKATTSRSLKLTDWALTLPTSPCPIYPIPDNGLLFHQYWSGPWRPFNEVSIEAFLATQRLEDGHKLIYWYENGAPSRATVSKFTTGEYGKYVEFREFNRTSEAEGYCVGAMPEYRDEEYQKELKMPASTLSDLVRTLLLAKYGGIWLDADTLPLRDLTPLMRSGPSAPWTVYDGDDVFNNNLLIYGPKEGGVAQKVLETTCKLSYNRTIFEAAYPETKVFMWHWLYNDGVLKICDRYDGCGINRHPVEFSDGRWFPGPGKKGVEGCDDFSGGAGGMGPGGAVNPELHGLWTWHARLGAREDSCLDEGADNVAMGLRRRLREMLALGLEMGGRDVFPGVGFM